MFFFILTRFSFFQKRFGCNFKGSLSEIPTVLGVWIFSGTTHCVNILRNITPQYTRFPLYNINFSYILLYRQSSILQGIYFLIHVYDYKNQGSRFGELHHCQTAETCRSTWCVILVIVENKPHAHHKTHLHIMNVVMILIPSFHGLR